MTDEELSDTEVERLLDEYAENIRAEAVCDTDFVSGASEYRKAADKARAALLAHLRARPAVTLGDRQMIAMVNAAMIEMRNIHPPLLRSECERLIRAALSRASAPVEGGVQTAPIAARIPQTAAAIRDFVGSQFCEMRFGREDHLPDDADRYTMTAHDLISAFDWWTDSLTPPAPEACPRGDARPEPTCTNRHQCWEPCGELGHSAEHVRVGRTSPEEVRRVLGVPAAPVPSPEPREPLHPLTADLVDRFAAALKEKLAAAEKKYGYSDGWADPGWMDECRAKLIEHVHKGDPRDVAAYCAFLWHHGARCELEDQFIYDVTGKWPTKPAAPPSLPETVTLLTDERIDQLVAEVFPPDRDSHYGLWLREIARPIARAIESAVLAHIGKRPAMSEDAAGVDLPEGGQ